MRIAKRDTSPELRVRSALHGLGARFRLHRNDLPGSPDIVLPSRRLAILVHGCFWHQHAGCSLGRQPKSRLEYWLPKLARNVDRDRLVRDALIEAGWQAEIIWECETRDAERLRNRLISLLSREVS